MDSVESFISASANGGEHGDSGTQKEAKTSFPAPCDLTQKDCYRRRGVGWLDRPL
jgi:hypothetical protein